MDKQKENNLSAIILFLVAYAAWLFIFLRLLNINGDDNWSLLVFVPFVNFSLLLLAFFIIKIGPSIKIKAISSTLIFISMLANFSSGNFLFLNTEKTALIIPAIPILILIVPIVSIYKKMFSNIP